MKRPCKVLLPVFKMKYSYVQFPDKTEITYGDMDSQGNVQIRIETPVEGGFNSLGCVLPSYRITEQVGYSQQEVDALMDFLRRNAHLIMEFAQTGGFENASAV